MPNKFLYLYITVIMPLMVLAMAFGMVILTSWTTTGRWTAFFDRARTETGRREMRVLYVLLAVMAVLAIGITVNIVWFTP